MYSKHSTRAGLPFWLAIGVLVLFSWAPGALAQQLELIPLQHRPAELLLPALREVASPTTQLSASGNQLIVRASDREMTRLKALIEQLDQPLAQFRISVRQQGRNLHSGRSMDGNYSHHQGQGGLRVGRTTLDGKPLPPEHAAGAHISSRGSEHTSSITVRQHSTRGDSDTSQQLRAVEGYPAYIETGEQIPFLSRYHDGYGRSMEQSYQPVVTGFYVTLSLSGNERVLLDIATTKQSVAEQTRHGGDYHNPTVNTAGYQSRISVPLGEWIDLGSSLQHEDSGSSGVVEYRSLQGQESFNLQLKIDRD